MIIEHNIKKHLQSELKSAKSVWIASAMISSSGWGFLKKNIPQTAKKYFLLGIDLATAPSVFEDLILQPTISSRILETAYTYHPKVYIVERNNGILTAFIGSSNTTTWGLEKNVEMNYQVHDQDECKELINWFNSLYSNGYLITEEFIKAYKTEYAKSIIRVKKTEIAKTFLKIDIERDKDQFFTNNQHIVFANKYHYIQNDELLEIRTSVKDRLIELHEAIYPKFASYGITDLYCHHQARERTSRHYFNRFSGYYVNAIWLHYGKSKSHLAKYSDEKDRSFINHARIQVIIHEDSIGIWLVLGKDWGSMIDRDFFRTRMNATSIQNKFFHSLKKLDNTYWIDFNGYSERVFVTDIKSAQQLYKITLRERIENYFIIGCDIDKFNSRLSAKNISKTILVEIGKSYQLYKIMVDK